MNSVKWLLLSIIFIALEYQKDQNQVGLKFWKEERKFSLLPYIIVSLENPEDTTKNF